MFEKNISLVTVQAEKLFRWFKEEVAEAPVEIVNKLTAKAAFDSCFQTWKTAAMIGGVGLTKKVFSEYLRDCQFVYAGNHPMFESLKSIVPTKDFVQKHPWAEGVSVAIRLDFLRGNEAFFLQKGDYVYIYPDEASDVAGIGIPPQMLQESGKRVVVEDILETARRRMKAALIPSSDGAWKFLYTFNWISYHKRGADEPKDNGKEEDQVKALFKEAVKRHAEVHKARFSPKEESMRASYAVIYKAPAGAPKIEFQFLDVCHARLRAHTGYKGLGVVDFIQMHLERGKMDFPCYKDDSDYHDKFSEFFDYWVNRGPFARVFETKNMFDALEYGVRYDVHRNSCSAIAAAAVGLRSMGEFRETPYAFHELKKMFPENVACVLAMLSSYDHGDKEWGFNFRGWHDILCANLDLEVFEAFKNPDLMPALQGRQPSYYDDPSRYNIYGGIGFCNGGTLAKALKVGYFGTFADLVEAACENDKIKEQML